MTLRERFNRIMRFQEVDRLPFVSFQGLCDVHRHRWIEEGMPADCNPYEYFGFDEATNDRATNWLNSGRGLETIDLDLHALPRFEMRQFEPQGEYFFTFDVRNGLVFRRLRPRSKGDLGVKEIFDTAVKTREDWLEVKKRYDPYTPERYPRLKQYDHHLTIYPLDYPETWEEALGDIERAAHIVTISMGHGFGYVSNAIGFEKLLTAVIDQADWIHEMVDYFCWFAREAQRKAFETARIDFIGLDGDISPPRTVHGELLVSPRMYLEYEGDHYKEYLAMAASNGIELAEVPLTRHRAFDDEILRMIVDAGLTPILLADAVGDFGLTERRREYGKQFPIWGGMEVRVLLQGPRAIDEMIDNVFSEAARGGVFPRLIDRYGELIEIPFMNFQYYVQAFGKANGM